MAEDGRGLDPRSLYRPDTPGGSPLSFDISNNQIACSLDRFGALYRVCVNNGVVPLGESSITGGVYTEKDLARGGGWRFRVGREFPSHVSVSLIANWVPEFRWSEGPLHVRQIVFAPVDVDDPAKSPRTLWIVFLIENRGSEAIDVPVVPPAGARCSVSAAETYRLDGGETKVVEAAISLDGDLTLDDAPCESFGKTVAWRRASYGELTIADAPFFAESTVRAAETCRQSFVRLPSGRFGGGFMGSDIDARHGTWNKDTFYCLLGAGYSEPNLLADAIPFYFRWGLPAKLIARGLARFPGGARITQSLSLAVAPLALAATYYRLTGDRDYFLRYPGFLERSAELCEEVVATRRGDPFLFPSMFISNGDARGHYHTGSNVVAWYAFAGLGRLAAEVFGDRELGVRWTSLAERVRRDIDAFCAGPGPEGRQFYEGVYEDRTYVPGHDGEESDTTLMPFYGYCDSDDPRLIRHARTGLSPANPYYAEHLDGIWWHNHGGFRPATAPAWATGLAAARTLGELRLRLNRFRELSDLDGSLWWWPYRFGETDRQAVLRGNGATKCGWASAVYLLRFVHDVLGIDVDVPERRIRLRPFSPWDYEWKGAKLGTARFDLRWRKGALTLTNRNAEEYRCELSLPGERGREVILSPRETVTVETR